MRLRLVILVVGLLIVTDRPKCAEGDEKKPKPVKKPQLVRKTLLVEQEKIDFVRQALELPSDAEVLRFALDHLLSHFEHQHGEEE